MTFFARPQSLIRVKFIIAMGFAAKKIEQSLESKFKVNLVKDLQEAGVGGTSITSRS